MDSLKKLRDRIDWLDTQIASLLNERMRAADQVGKIKRIIQQDVTDQSREKIVLKFWSGLLGLPDHQFRKVVFIKVKNKKVYENHNSYYGVLALRVRKGTSPKYLALGLIEECKANAGVAQVVRA